MNDLACYEIRIDGQLTDRWTDWFAGLMICEQDDGSTLLKGQLADQAELIGLLSKLQALNLTILSVKRSPPDR